MALPLVSRSQSKNKLLNVNLQDPFPASRLVKGLATRDYFAMEKVVINNEDAIVSNRDVISLIAEVYRNNS